MDKESLWQIIATSAKLAVNISELNDESNLYEAGLTSLNTVNLMLAIEDHFEIEFDDDSLTRDTFKSVRSLAAVVQSLANNAE